MVRTIHFRIEASDFKAMRQFKEELEKKLKAKISDAKAFSIWRKSQFPEFKGTVIEVINGKIYIK